jgi:hypothetical protein
VSRSAVTEASKVKRAVTRRSWTLLTYQSRTGPGMSPLTLLTSRESPVNDLGVAALAVSVLFVMRRPVLGRKRA